MHLAFLLALTCQVSSGSAETRSVLGDSIQSAALAPVRGALFDPRDRKTYPTVRIGSRTWMAANLDFDAVASRCYDDRPESCERYGRLYDWEGALHACPVGWHLPDDAEWTLLEEGIGGRLRAGILLKSSDNWSYLGAGKDSCGFTVLPAGYCVADGSCVYQGDDADFWSATSGDELSAWHRGYGYGGPDADRDLYYKTSFFSVRCVQDTAPLSVRSLLSRKTRR